LPHDFALTGAHALVGTVSCNERADIATRVDVPVRAERGQRHDATNITVEIAAGDRLAGLESDWLSLTGRADSANIFMNPTLVRLAGEAYPSSCCALLAWQDKDAHRQLVGVWAFAMARAPHSIIPVTALTTPPMPHSYLGTPVIDRDCLEQVLDAMLDCVADDEQLPKILALDAMDSDVATMHALSRVLAARGSAPCILGRSQRPKLASELDGKAYMEKALSSSSRKKLRQHRRRLTEKGALEFSILTNADAVSRAFEDFLQLEASGWKGRQGTALLNHSSDATFVRAMIAALAARGEACIYMLTLDARPIGMQVVLRAGQAAFTWKTAYDEALHDFSPGMLLLEDYTAAFLADDGIAYVDSCAFDDSGYMAAWSERKAIAQIWVDARRGRSISFALLSRIQMGTLALRNHVKTIYRKYLKRK